MLKLVSSSTDMKNYKTYIAIDKSTRFGRPCVKGTRISVYDVLNWLSIGQSQKEIIKDFPELSKTKIRACLAFAADKESKTRVA